MRRPHHPADGRKTKKGDHQFLTTQPLYYSSIPVVDPSTALEYHLHISEPTSVTTRDQLTVKGFANGGRDGRSEQEHAHHK